MGLTPWAPPHAYVNKRWGNAAQPDAKAEGCVDDDPPMADKLFWKKCMEYEVEGPRPRGRAKKTWRKVVREDCLARKMNKEDAIDRCKWRKMIKDVR